MKKFKIKHLSTLVAAVLATTAPAITDAAPGKFGFVNFKSVVEKSKMGQQEQQNFDGLRKQMEEMMEQKEKALQDLSKKLNDADYMDSLSADAEAEMKHKFRNMNQEMGQYQQQYYQILQQANFKIVQNVHEKVNEAAQKVAKNKGLDVVINEEGTFYFNPTLDISEDVIKTMDENFKPEPTK